jgi:hypothetical protein
MTQPLTLHSMHPRFCPSSCARWMRRPLIRQSELFSPAIATVFNTSDLILREDITRVRTRTSFTNCTAPQRTLAKISVLDDTRYGNRMKVTIFPITCLILVGCAPATIEGLRRGHAQSYELVANQNYHLHPVYRQIRYQVRKCYLTRMITAQLVIRGGLFSNLKRGNVNIARHGGLGVETYMAIDIEAVDRIMTRVVVYNTFSTWNTAASAVKEWVLEESSICGPKEDI